MRPEGRGAIPEPLNIRTYAWKYMHYATRAGKSRPTAGQLRASPQAVKITAMVTRTTPDCSSSYADAISRQLHLW
eukprot:COSAG06_NODE_3353_length_5471_cov_33.163068_5_plen_75_part_00